MIRETNKIFFLKILELETELEAEKTHHQDSIKDVRKTERKMKELLAQVDEDSKMQSRLQDTIMKLENKLKQFKRQVEETEEAAALNLAKFRKVQHAQEEAEQSETIVKSKVFITRSTVSEHRTTSSPIVIYFV